VRFAGAGTETEGRCSLAAGTSFRAAFTPVIAAAAVPNAPARAMPAASPRGIAGDRANESTFPTPDRACRSCPVQASGSSGAPLRASSKAPDSTTPANTTLSADRMKARSRSFAKHSPQAMTCQKTASRSSTSSPSNQRPSTTSLGWCGSSTPRLSCRIKVRMGHPERSCWLLPR
jgi:hypothetical protein